MQSVFTVAIGSEVYLDYALTLARSFLLHHKHSEIIFFIFTDLVLDEFEDIGNIQKVIIDQNLVGKGISCKLYLDKLAPTEKSLFIDADCLCFGNLEKIFKRFAGRPVSVVGFPISHGEWCGVLAEEICRTFNVSQIPRFNGGIYYIERGEAATKIYNTARTLEMQYDQLGFTKHRGWHNEEPLLSIAIAVNNGTALIDDGTIMSDLASCPQSADLDVLNGKCLLINPALPDLKHKWWYKYSKYSPTIIHFSGSMGTSYLYSREKFKLLLESQFRYPIWVITVLGYCLFTLPNKIVFSLKNVIRPVYKLLFGYRKIIKSNRTFNDI